MSARFLSILMCLSVGAGCSSLRAAPAEQGAKRKAPETVALTARKLPRTLSYAGTIVAPRDATVSSSRGGRVDAYSYDVGQRAKSGEVLVKLGAAELNYASQAAVASANQVAARISGARDAASLPSTLAAKAELDNATDAAERSEKLYARGSTSEQEIRRVRTNLSAAKARYDASLADARAEFSRLQELQALAGQASAALGDKAIRAPFDGIVLERFVDIGQVAAPNAPLLRVLDPSELRVRFEVSQFDASEVVLGRRVTVLFQEKTMVANVVRSTPGLVGVGNSRLVEAKLVDVPEPAPLPGALLPTWLETSVEEELIEIDEAATTRTAGVMRAWVVVDHKLEERLLSIARTEGNRVFVRRGLHAGEALVKVPQPDFRIGEEVAP